MALARKAAGASHFHGFALNIGVRGRMLWRYPNTFDSKGTSLMVDLMLTDVGGIVLATNATALECANPCDLVEIDDDGVLNMERL